MNKYYDDYDGTVHECHVKLVDTGLSKGYLTYTLCGKNTGSMWAFRVYSADDKIATCKECLELKKTNGKKP